MEVYNTVEIYNSHWIILATNNTVSSSHAAFNIMNESFSSKECDVSCNFIFLSNCMTKWFLHSLGIIYWRGFELLLQSFYYFFLSSCIIGIYACLVGCKMPLRCSHHHHLWSVGLVCIGTHSNDSKIIWLMKIKMVRDYFSHLLDVVLLALMCLCNPEG